MSPRIITFTLLIAVFLCAGLAFADEYQASKQVGDFEVMLTIDKNPPVVGNNNVTIVLKNSSGKPVTDAAVRLDYGMAAMPGMPAMNYTSDAVLSGESYQVPMNPSMAGPWFITVKILREKKIETAKFNVDVQ